MTGCSMGYAAISIFGNLRTPSMKKKVDPDPGGGYFQEVDFDLRASAVLICNPVSRREVTLQERNPSRLYEAVRH